MKKVNIKLTLFTSAIVFLALWLSLSLNCISTGEPEPCEPDTLYIQHIDTLFIDVPIIVIKIDTLYKLDTIYAVITDTLYLPEPQPVFNQIPARTAYTLSWHAEPDSTMGIFLVYNVSGINLPGYLIKEVAYPESTCILDNTLLNFESQDYLLTKIYMQAKDNAGNLSAPTADSVKAVFARTPGTWGDVTGGKGFDSKDLSIMEYDSKKGYNPAFDFNSDAKIDSLDFEIVRGK